MVARLSNGRLFFHVAILMLVGSSAVSCGHGASPTPPVSPLPPIVTPTDPHSIRTPASVETGQVYPAQIHGAWAPGYPYPVFFLDIPCGTATLTLAEVVYGSSEPLNEAHPRLEKVVQEVIWPDGSVSQLIAQDFYYDEAQGLLPGYSATLDGIPLDTVSYDVFATEGVGIAFLGDTGGVNVFYNCISPTTIDYQELATDDYDRPTAANFQWRCEADSYDMHVEVVWGRSDPHYDIDVITGLSATITRG